MSDAGARRVLFVAYYFPPSAGAPVQRSLKFVKYLRRFGWEPTVLTTQCAKRSAAYDETLLAEIPEDTQVVRIPSSESFFVALSRIGLGRLSGIFLRPDTQVTWVRRALRTALEMHEARPFQAVYTSVQPWSAGLVGMRFKERTNVPWVSDFRDPWTRSLHLAWPTKFHWRRDLCLEGRYLDAADRTLVVTPTMRDQFLADHPEVAPSSLDVLYNGYDEEDFPVQPPHSGDKFTIAFTGKFQFDHRDRIAGASVRERVGRLGTCRRRDVMLDTHSPVYFLEGLSKFLARFPGRRAKTRVVFAGAIGEGNRALVAKLGLEDVVECPGYLTHGESVALLKSADALLLPMFSTADPAERVPYASGKVFEYMAARRPILLLAQEGDARDLALRSGLGLAVPPRDCEAISRAIERLYDGRTSGSSALRPDEEFISRFSRERLTRRLAEILDEAVAGAGVKA